LPCQNHERSRFPNKTVPGTFVRRIVVNLGRGSLHEEESP
jgi:hypothetical protein